jgi:biotin carboxyl carrier protein
MEKPNQIEISGFDKISSDLLSGKFSVLEYYDQHMKVSYEGKTFNAIIKNKNFERKEFTINISGYNFIIKIEEPLDQLINQLGFRTVKSASVKEIKAPMPGMVVGVHISEGDHVQAGDKLISLEAMKMENIIKSFTAGVISKVYVGKGSSVEKSQILVEFE